MIIAAPKTGVTKANIRIVNNKLIVINGKIDLRLRNPEAACVRRVINKFVNDIVVLIPANITEIIKISCAPIPVYLILDENGVIKVQPAVVKTLLLHLEK
jgi:hypothetical protein